jgi:hypothetical protein
MLEIDDDVRIAVAKRAITSIVPPGELDRLEGDAEAEAEAQTETETAETASKR